MLLVAAAALAGCKAGSGADPKGSPLPVSASPAALAPSPSPSPSRPTAHAVAAALVARLSHRQLAGQRVIASYPGLVPPTALVRAIEAGDVAGVCFFSGNIAGDAQIRRVTAELQRAAARSPVRLPLLLMVDQEGGTIRRLPGAPRLSETQIGESADPPRAAVSAGHAAGVNLRAAGFDVNLAPVLDVYRSDDGFIERYGRSYSHSRDLVATLGYGFVRAQQKAGVLAVAKHFPGLGSATSEQDTDAAPVVLRIPLAELRAVDEHPYAVVIPSVRIVMVSWAVYPALGGDRPAGFSRAVVLGELRRRLGFKGVTITDSLEAGALRPYGTVAARAVDAANAGMDVLLCTGRYGDGVDATTALAGALAAGRLDRRRFVAAVERIVELRLELRDGLR